MYTTFFETLDAIRPLLDHPELADRWDEPSALERMTIGALTAHLGRAATVVDQNLDTVGEQPLRDAPGYFINLMQEPDTDLDSDLAVSVRRRAEEDAEPGYDAVRQRWDDVRRRLGQVLPAVDPNKAIAVRSSSMTVSEYLKTRLVELVVHADDLSASLGTDAPELPASATRDVLACLTEMLARRNGPLSVIRAMSRVERGDPAALRAF